MANGQMLAELREMAQAEKITTPAALRLIITSQIEFHEKLSGMEKDQKELRDQLMGTERTREKDAEEASDQKDTLRREQNDLIQTLTNKVQELSDGMTKDIKNLSDRVDCLASDPVTGINRLFKNPLIVVGFFVQKHPKWALTIFILFLLMLNLWLIDDFRIAVLQWAHVPDFFIHALNPTPMP